MEVYHITREIYTVGSIVSINDFQGESRYHQGLSEDKKAINDYLSEGRPEGEPARHRCLYTFATPDHCMYFRKRDLDAGEVMHLYRCKMDCQMGHPMILVGKCRLQLAENVKEALRAEYWRPTRQWKFLEFLSEQMEILEEIEIPTYRAGINCSGCSIYSEDVTMAERLIEKLEYAR